jgi:hypothetical protein
VKINFDPAAPSTWQIKPLPKNEKVVVLKDVLSFRRTISNFFGSNKDVSEDERE